MYEEQTISTLQQKEASAILCEHLSNETGKGFNVSTDINNDLEAWCNKCEAVLVEEMEWTTAALNFANFKGCCIGCFIFIKNVASKQS